MADFSSGQFECNGKKYTFVAKLKHGEDGEDLALDNGGIELFEYENEIGKLYLTGHIIYNDQYGRVDSFINDQGCMCSVTLTENEQEFDEDMTIETMSKDRKFFHIFFVNSMEILDRKHGTVKYRMNLVGIERYNVLKRICYSNYKKGEEPVTDILKECIVAAGLDYDKDSFGDGKSEVKIKYITSKNDCLQTIFRYLAKRMFYYGRDSKLKFVYYNEYVGAYCVLDITNSNTFNKTTGRQIIISPLKNNLEQVTSALDTKLGMITRFQREDTIQLYHDYDFYDYDYDTNKIINRNIKGRTLENYVENMSQDFEDENEANPHNVDAVMDDYTQSGSLWNNDYDIYADVLRSLTKGNALVVKAVGDVLTMPAQLCVLNIDRQQDDITGEWVEDFEDLSDRYRGFEGSYFISRVHHVIKPATHEYIQMLSLFRNFRLKTKD